MIKLRHRRKHKHPITLEWIFSNCDVNSSTNCHEWIGCKNEYGYGMVVVDYRDVRLHRIVYELVHGKIADNDMVLHECDNPICCNPKHLFLGTGIDNIKDMISKDRHGRGMRARHAKLTDDEVLRIRGLNLRKGEISTTAKGLGISIKALYYIRKRITWKHL